MISVTLFIEIMTYIYIYIYIYIYTFYQVWRHTGKVKFIAYTEDIVETVDTFRVDHHLYADDTQLQDHMRIATIQANRLNLERCFDAIKDWCASRRLQLNGYKTEIIWFDSRAHLKSSLQRTQHYGLDRPSLSQWTQCVTWAFTWTVCWACVRTHIGKVSTACFYHLRRLRQLRYAV